MCCIFLLMNNRLEGFFIGKYFINMSFGCMVILLWKIYLFFYEVIVSCLWLKVEFGKKNIEK